MSHRIFGTLADGQEVLEYTLKNEHITLDVITLGASMRRLFIRDTDIIGGYDTLEEYVADADPFQGAIIGRVSNRIKAGRITLGGKDYQLTQNQNGHHLHGGELGFHRRVWQVEEASETSLTLSRLSPAGEEGYPANLFTEVTYSLTDDCLMIEFRAKADGETPVSMTAHPFFNLNGVGSGDILDHTALIYADRYTEVDDTLIPTGNRPSVLGTPMDFRVEKTLRRDFSALSSGYDHNLLFSADAPKASVCGKLLTHAASFAGERVKMDVFTDAEGAQLYSGDYLNETLKFKGGTKKAKNFAFCFEPQAEPDGIHRGVPPLSAGDMYTSTIVYRLT